MNKGVLQKLALIDVGPAREMILAFAPRINVITGDNGLGKSFLLDCAWWALCGRWADPDQPAYPSSDPAREPRMEFAIAGNHAQSPASVKVLFNQATQSWDLPNGQPSIPKAIVIYARIDGSCLIWDPAKHALPVGKAPVGVTEAPDAIRLSQNDIWDGLDVKSTSGKKQVICNGLIRDWITWQYGPTRGAFATFSRVLEKLSPHPNEFMMPGTSTRLPGDAREIPTLKFPYGEVPILLLSAGIKRILSIAYLLVWTWEEHKTASRKIGKAPLSNIVFLIDEMEAHLHPQWQRTIVPALIDVIKTLEEQLAIQLIIATHSPLVLASVEPLFQQKTDCLFTLDIIDKKVEIRETPYLKYGSINSWLTSEIFDLKRPYSISAEEALVDAKQLQLMDHPNSEKVREVSNRLVQYLPDIDPFWPRWKYFAEQNGVVL